MRFTNFIFIFFSFHTVFTRTWLRYVRVFAIAIPSVCLSVVCLSVTLVHPTQGFEPFGKISSPLCMLAIIWPPCKILRRSSYFVLSHSIAHPLCGINVAPYSDSKWNGIGFVCSSAPGPRWGLLPQTPVIGYALAMSPHLSDLSKPLDPPLVY